MEAVMFQNVYGYHGVYIIRDHLVYAHSQWEVTLQCNVASHWLGTCIHKMIPVSCTYLLWTHEEYMVTDEIYIMLYKRITWGVILLS